MPGRTSWRSAWLPLAFWVTVIFGLSSIPDLSPPQVGIPMTDKLAHFGEYGILGALFTRARSGRRGTARSLLTGLFLGLPVAVARPTIVVGDSRTGRVVSCNVMYTPLRWIGRCSRGKTALPVSESF